MSQPVAMVWIVIGMTGEYSDRYEWPVAAYTTQEAAEEHVRLASLWLKQNCDFNKPLGWRERKAWLSVNSNPYDPKMQIDYTGTDWFVEGPIPLHSGQPVGSSSFPEEHLQDATEGANQIPSQGGSRMSHWNYRILEQHCDCKGETETYYEVVEVYYDDDGKANAWCPSSLIGDAPADIEWTLERMKEAAGKPVLKEADFKSDKSAQSAEP